MIVKAEGPSGHAKIRADDPKHALGLVEYLREHSDQCLRRMAELEVPCNQPCSELDLSLPIEGIQQGGANCLSGWRVLPADQVEARMLVHCRRFIQRVVGIGRQIARPSGLSLQAATRAVSARIVETTRAIGCPANYGVKETRKDNDPDNVVDISGRAIVISELEIRRWQPKRESVKRLDFLVSLQANART